MAAGRYKIVYGATAIEEMDALPVKHRTQIIRKIERLQSGLHGDIKRLQSTDVTY